MAINIDNIAITAERLGLFHLPVAVGNVSLEGTGTYVTDLNLRDRNDPTSVPLGGVGSAAKMYHMVLTNAGEVAASVYDLDLIFKPLVSDNLRDIAYEQVWFVGDNIPTVVHRAYQQGLMGKSFYLRRINESSVPVNPAIQAYVVPFWAI